MNTVCGTVKIIYNSQNSDNSFIPHEVLGLGGLIVGHVRAIKELVKLYFENTGIY